MHDDGVTTLSVDVGPPGSLVWNPGSPRRRSSQWWTRHSLGECDETSEREISLPEMDIGSEFTRSWLEQQPDFSICAISGDVCEWCQAG